MYVCIYISNNLKTEEELFPFSLLLSSVNIHETNLLGRYQKEPSEVLYQKIRSTTVYLLFRHATRHKDHTQGPPIDDYLSPC